MRAEAHPVNHARRPDAHAQKHAQNLNIIPKFPIACIVRYQVGRQNLGWASSLNKRRQGSDACVSPYNRNFDKTAETKPAGLIESCFLVEYKEVRILSYFCPRRNIYTK